MFDNQKNVDFKSAQDKQKTKKWPQKALESTIAKNGDIFHLIIILPLYQAYYKVKLSFWEFINPDLEKMTKTATGGAREQIFEKAHVITHNFLWAIQSNKN